jgi:hypothetical protein
MTKNDVKHVSKAEAIRIASKIFGRNVSKYLLPDVMGWYTFRVGVFKLMIYECYNVHEEGAPSGAITVINSADYDNCFGYAFKVINGEIVTKNYVQTLFDQLADKLLRATQVNDQGELVITSKTNLSRAIDIANGDGDLNYNSDV